MLPLKEQYLPLLCRKAQTLHPSILRPFTLSASLWLYHPHPGGSSAWTVTGSDRANKDKGATNPTLWECTRDESPQRIIMVVARKENMSHASYFSLLFVLFNSNMNRPLHFISPSIHVPYNTFPSPAHNNSAIPFRCKCQQEMKKNTSSFPFPLWPSFLPGSTWGNVSPWRSATLSTSAAILHLHTHLFLHLGARE